MENFIYIHNISQDSENERKRIQLIKKIVLIFTVILLGLFIYGFIHAMINIRHYKNKNSLEYLLKLIAVFIILFSASFIPRKNSEIILLIIAMALYTVKYFIVYFYIVSNK
jgi:hypothetical protein